MLIGQDSFACALPARWPRTRCGRKYTQPCAYAAMAGEGGDGIGTGEAGVLLFLLAANVETVAPARGVLGFALEALLVLLLGRARAQQSNCQK